MRQAYLRKNLGQYRYEISTREDLLNNTYTANALNEYTSITTPGYKDICAAAIATNGVTVNGNTADRKVVQVSVLTIDTDPSPAHQALRGRITESRPGPDHCLR